MFTNFIIFFVIFSIILLVTCKKFNILIDKKIETHKKYSTKENSYLLGGVLLILFLSYYYLFLFEKYSFYLFLLFVFVIGLMADIKGINSVSQRFLLQIIIIICFVNLINIEINSTKIIFIDQILDVALVNIFFVTFCLLVLINGTNFLDGINGLVLSYYIMISLIFLFNLNHFIFDEILLLNFTYILSFLLFLNLLGFIYLGDSGSYTISLFTGIFLINFASDNNSVSPYFIIVLLWYPCFELLFSMVRRSIQEIKTYRPDTSHLHQIIYKNLKSNINTKNNLFLHFVSTLIINSYNLICFLIALKYIYNSEMLIFIIAINVTVYILTYNTLKLSLDRVKRKQK